MGPSSLNSNTIVTLEKPFDIRLEHRQKWLSALKQNQNGGVNMIRAAIPGTYTWLYRHDREWLTTHMPEVKRQILAGKRRVD